MNESKRQRNRNAAAGKEKKKKKKRKKRQEGGGNKGRQRCTGFLSHLVFLLFLVSVRYLVSVLVDDLVTPNELLLKIKIAVITGPHTGPEGSLPASTMRNGSRIECPYASIPTVPDIITHLNYHVESRVHPFHSAPPVLPGGQGSIQFKTSPPWPNLDGYHTRWAKMSSTRILHILPK
ncbi:hypothetical protein BC939DRAFT_59190 [Gamsiella multidivaricata]|uniref:uncharacterized protein n=1 Tax=Gamsiella multidivaricata TaxID=101098 RepID=UPI00222024B7|nr:uncharacterized protein BC939DRAFT_59190 [Gamsiella multidivaricata]KAI7828532.1 hypothetical protein BC939DRAFT_59190 [Gamsiella multidivaricata]